MVRGPVRRGDGGSSTGRAGARQGERARRTPSVLTPIVDLKDTGSDAKSSPRPPRATPAPLPAVPAAAMDVVARMLGQPVADRLGLVGGRVVEHEVYVEVWRDLRVHLVQEPAELGGAAAGGAAADHRPRLHVERGEQARGAVGGIVVGVALRLARPQRQERLGTVERLHLARSSARTWLFSSTRSSRARPGGAR